MIDIELIRNNIQLVIDSETKRFRDPQTVKDCYELDQKWKKLRFQVDQMNKKLNVLQNDIKKICKEQKLIQKKSENKNSEKTDDKSENNIENLDSLTLNTSLNEKMEQLIIERNNVKTSKETLAEELNSIQSQLTFKLNSIGNILHPDVVISKDEDNNPVIETYNSERTIKPLLNFHEICNKLQGCDTVRGSKIAGHRAYFLQNDIALLANSLSRYCIDFLIERNFTYIQTPVYLHKNVMSQTAQLSDFDDQLYDFDDFYLIATSEQPLSAYFKDEIVKVPVKFAGQSLCFRKEAGAHGKDNLGIFRTHQFEKIEQFILCTSNESDNYFKEMIGNAKEFYKSLDISYRVVGIVSGSLNDAAIIKYDLEALFPKQNVFRELVSCSNCTDYQSRNLNVRVKHKKEFAHMLNCTLSAIQRTLCCLVENYQEEDGIRIPKVLIPYMKKDFLPYIKSDNNEQ